MVTFVEFKRTIIFAGIKTLVSFIFFLTLGALILILFQQKYQPTLQKPSAITNQPGLKKILTATQLVETQHLNPHYLKKVSYLNLPGWQKTSMTKSLQAFQLSCKNWSVHQPEHSVGSTIIKLKASDWQPACTAALKLSQLSALDARIFFERWFQPIEFSSPKITKGLFTGYFLPHVRGSLVQTKDYHVPIYGMPYQLTQDKKISGIDTDILHTIKPLTYYTRVIIDSGALTRKAPVIVWINNAVDRIFLEIEGGGVIELANKKKIYITYAGDNGAAFTSIAGIMIKQGMLTKDTSSNAAIKQFFAHHPEKVASVLHQNKSFVFFEKTLPTKILGAQGVALTPGYSLAIDKKWIPLGTPLWVETKKPERHSGQEKQWHRLMIAQDTGGAIRGIVRGDIYWGSGDLATYLGQHMKNVGRYWLLLPKSIVG